MSELGCKDFLINWDRAIFIDEEINDTLVKRLTPTILKLRQENNDPITIGIDSPGGSLDSLDILLGLLTGPTQNGKRGQIITVATNTAYSAAANFLAFGDYSIALRHAKILYHDVRYSGIIDVTPDKALRVAKSLKEANDNFSLRLANRIVQRLIWIYLDLEKQFIECNGRYPDIFKQYERITSKYAPKIDGHYTLEIASFATCIYAQLSRTNDGLIRTVMNRLSRWIILTNLAEGIPSFKAKGSRKSGLLDGVRDLHKLLDGKPKNFESNEINLKLLLTLLIGEMSEENSTGKSFQEHLEEASRDFTLMQSMNDEKHRKAAMKLMRDHESLFIGKMTKAEFDEKTEPEKNEILAKSLPHAQIFWLFCALLCRELFEGEHILTPQDAQLLGLVDEVAGGGKVESVREYHARPDEDSQEPSSP